MPLIEEINAMNEQELADYNRKLERQFVKHIALRITVPIAAVVATNYIIKRIENGR